MSNKDLAEKIKVKTFKTWINIRTNSFVKVLISIVRREASYENRASSYGKAGQLFLKRSLSPDFFLCSTGILTVYADKVRELVHLEGNCIVQ